MSSSATSFPHKHGKPAQVAGRHDWPSGATIKLDINLADKTSFSLSLSPCCSSGVTQRAALLPKLHWPAGGRSVETGGEKSVTSSKGLQLCGISIIVCRWKLLAPLGSIRFGHTAMASFQLAPLARPPNSLCARSNQWPAN